MFLYFDNGGKLKEIYTEKSANLGSSNWDIIYSFFEGDSVGITGCFIKYLKPDKTFTIEAEGTIETRTLPPDNERDLKFFEFGKPYKFRKFVIPDEILASAGNYAAFIRYSDSEHFFAMTEATFDVSGGNLTLDPVITISQYNYLLNNISNIKPKYYKHTLYAENNTHGINICVINNSLTPYTNETFIKNMQNMGGLNHADQPIIFSFYGYIDHICNLTIELSRFEPTLYFSIGYLDYNDYIYLDNMEIVSDDVEEL